MRTKNEDKRLARPATPPGLARNFQPGFNLGWIFPASRPDGTYKTYWAGSRSLWKAKIY